MRSKQISMNSRDFIQEAVELKKKLTWEKCWISLANAGEGVWQDFIWFINKFSNSHPVLQPQIVPIVFCIESPLEIEPPRNISSFLTKCVWVGGQIGPIETNIDTKTWLCFDQQVFSCEINSRSRRTEVTLTWPSAKPHPVTQPVLSHMMNSPMWPRWWNWNNVESTETCCWEACWCQASRRNSLYENWSCMKDCIHTT